MGYWTPSMESCSSGEEVVMKARKPYTITKQRERWTEEEHNRFLEALKLYGRAWQRIEEHIGTKTAIQIRSHAQKFFTKLEKEALSKGIPPGQTLDIDIPPPRPKRKPSNPYPRKSGVVASSSTKEEKQDKSVVASQSQCPNVEVSESGKGAPDAKPDRMGTLENATEARENGACTEVLPLFNDLLTSVNSKRNSGHPLIVGEFIPKSQKEKKGKTITNKMVTASEENGESKHHTSDVGDANICRLEGRHINSQAKMTPLERLNKHKQPEKLETPSTNNAERVEHVPMHPIHETKDGGEAACSDLRNTVPVPSINPQAAQMNTNTLRNPSISTAPVHQTGSSVSFFHQLPSFPPFFLPQGQDAYQSVSNASSTFSNFIVSTLVQNPAAHAAATAAVSFWPPQDSDKSKNFIPETMNGTIPGGHVNPHPSMAAIAADTVAAATAWWAMHGLFPLCHPPFPTGFPFVSAATTTSPIVTASQVKEKQERRNNLSRIHPEKDKSTLNSKLPEHLMLRCLASKSAPSSESDESRGHKRPDGTNLKSSGTIKLASTRDTTFRESNSKEGNKKRKEDFCCDYCKHSGSDATDTIEEDLQSKEKQQEFLVHHTSTVETSFTRCRHSVNCVNESRKEVSEEGRLAFQALFSREELPQSFSPPPPKDGAIKQCGDLGAATPPVDLNNNSHAYSSENDHCSGSDDVHARNNDCLEKSTSICEKGNLKSEAHRMGFKPYKRCSMEANVGRINSEEEKGGKRLHMEGKTSNL